jgi:hypothetical protein
LAAPRHLRRVKVTFALPYLAVPILQWLTR